MTIESANENFLTDILVTAVEGGINYWAIVEGYQHSGEPADRKVVVRHPEGVAQVTLRDIVLAVRKIINKRVPVTPYIRDILVEADKTLDAGDIDAEVADVVVQVAAFGKIVYG